MAERSYLLSTAASVSCVFFGVLIALLASNFLEEQSSVYDKCQEFIAWRAAAYKDGAKFGTKTAYLFDAPRPENETTIDGCTSVQLYLIIRHGTRTPLKKDIQIAAVLHERVQQLMTKPVITETAAKLSGWANPFKLESVGMLSSSGMKEIFCLANRFQNRFPKLLPKQHLSQENLFRATFKPRTVQSVLSFAHGLYNDHAPLFGYQPIHVENADEESDSLLRFFSVCPVYSWKVKKNQTVHDHVNHFLRTSHMRLVLENVQQKLDPEQQTWNVSVEETTAMFRQCAFEKAVYGVSIWCDVFTVEDLAVLEYYIDLENYWEKGYGYPINWQMSCPLVSDIVHQLSSAASDWEGKDGNKTTNSHVPKALIRMGHAETLIPLVCALGLFRDPVPLPSGSYQSDRQFKQHNFAGFAGNMALALYHCPKSMSKFMVRVLVNEREVEIPHPACAATHHQWCPLTKFPEIISDLSGGLLSMPCNFTHLCT